jgi:hypothetical protein
MFELGFITGKLIQLAVTTFVTAAASELFKDKG